MWGKPVGTSVVVSSARGSEIGGPAVSKTRGWGRAAEGANCSMGRAASSSSGSWARTAGATDWRVADTVDGGPDDSPGEAWLDSVDATVTMRPASSASAREAMTASASQALLTWRARRIECMSPHPVMDVRNA